MKEYKKSSQDRWRGKRYISQVRQSNDSEGTTSTQAQLKWMHAEGDRLGMIHVGDIVLNGLTGSLPGKRTDLDTLLKRKRECNDFDILLIQKCDRLTRSGSDHAGWFHHEAAKAGIEIMYPGDNLPEDGSFNGMIRAAMFDAAREQAKSIGQRSVQGNMYGINRGRNCVISRTPFGCDRLYFNAQKDPLFIIRNLGDGRQQKLDPKTHRVIDTYGQAGKGTKGHYRKQRDEGVLIVPGSDDRVEVVRLIFDQHYSHNWGGKRIANLLNRRGILSPTGIGWSQRQVESLYENPVFCGWALGRRVAQGIYFCQGDDQPIPVEHDPIILANCHTPPRTLRPPDDWNWQLQPQMLDFLPKDMAEKALPLIKHGRGYENWST
jgi:Recombinase/Resolvase, N terminal domain